MIKVFICIGRKQKHASGSEVSCTLSLSKQELCSELCSSGGQPLQSALNCAVPHKDTFSLFHYC